MPDTRSDPCADSADGAALILAELKTSQGGAKGLAAAGGWVFLINDTNDFLAWQYGVSRWTPEDRSAVRNLLTERTRILADRCYQMVISPEKSVVYAEWLPGGLDRLSIDPARPAVAMAQMFPNEVLYLAPRLEELKRLGLLFFRGDTHVNWLGAYHVYRETILALAARGAAVGTPIGFAQLGHYIAGMEGDILMQLPEAARPEFERGAVLGRVGAMLEVTISHVLPESKRRARQVPTPGGYVPGGGGRETIIMEQDDQTLPRALVFRDSTATLSIDLLAEHFSRSVYIWHEGDVIGALIDREQPDIILHFVAERFLATYPRAMSINRALG
ncbi:MAG: hypothetical protein B7Y78_02890 [Caulobacter sp. 35-67-4]|nr:MAG: hypothetical protein B7Y81_13345 [Caulobacter sp. 32-67-35]OYX96899.1 MAG: hypothetical protein B7Y78_02890 [Caulobacter sp. 35-67-4]